VILLPPHQVRPYVKRSKTDRTDAKGILEASRNEDIRPVPIKTVPQQVLTSLHRLRQGWMTERTARLNALRGLLRWREGDLEASERLFRQADELAERVGWSEVSCSALLGLSATMRDRGDLEAAERELAERWCEGADGELFVDGAITASERVATSSCVVGVVKSHRTLYAEGDALRAVLHLERGARTSVFRITSPKRTPVASWYLRLRDPHGRDPLWGLVRVEVAEPRGASAKTIGERADEVSSWVLAEALPLAVPDARWDKMVYGIRDCEEFLRAIQ